MNKTFNMDRIFSFTYAKLAGHGCTTISYQQKFNRMSMRIAFLILVVMALLSCQHTNTMHKTETYAFRLKPGQDLKKEILKLAGEKQISAGWIVTCVGSLTNYHIRFANQTSGSSDSGHFEIVSLTGTVSMNGSHLHISVSDSTGRTTGGHLLDGNIVYSTAEIVIQSSPEYVFKREKDGTTPWEELQIEKLK